MTRLYQRCTRCVMDTTDPEIAFDQQGHCNHCTQFLEVKSKSWYPNDQGKALWDEKLRKIRASGKGREYDCILGLSGGFDSSYVAIKAFEWGVRPLVVHVDGGWNSELAVSNIERLVRHCKFDLHTVVINWRSMRNLQLAYLKSGIANQDVPQDHAFFASLYRYAADNGVKYVLSGGNLATEGIFPSAWQGDAMDAKNLLSIYQQFGEGELGDFPLLSFFDYYIKIPLLQGMRTLRPLNYMPYNKKLAAEELREKVGWRSYERKHGESRFTKFFQNYYLPTKFGYDKRLPHLSSLIVSGGITREEALVELDKPLYERDELAADIEYVCKKLRISEAEFQAIMAAPSHEYHDFPNWEGQKRSVKTVQNVAARLMGKKISVYS